MDQARCPHLLKKSRSLARFYWTIAGNTHVKRLSAVHEVRKSAHGLFQWCVGIVAVGIENVDVLQPHPLQALIGARDDVFP